MLLCVGLFVLLCWYCFGAGHRFAFLLLGGVCLVVVVVCVRV